MKRILLSLMTALYAVCLFASEAPEAEPIASDNTGNLPLLYIYVYESGTDEFNNSIIDPDLAHKDYFDGYYRLETNGCEWLEELGAENIGTEEEPLPLQIKARGNYTRIAYSKKPYKIKLGKKESLLGLSKSKHFALLAHADDSEGFLRNFTGFNLGHRIGLPWTPSQQPVELYINDDYRGLYFLTESIRVDEERINITELNDNETDPALISGGYLVELDNYDEPEDIQIQIPEKYCAGKWHNPYFRVTFHEPESYSDLQRKFITDQFNAINDGTATCNMMTLFGVISIWMTLPAIISSAK